MVRKEWKQYTSSSVYVINTGIGVLLLIVASVALLINKDAVLSGVQGIGLAGEILPYLIPFAAAFFLAMTNTADVSISLEGRQLPLLKSLPLRPMTIFQGKILLNLMLTAPAVLISMPVLAAAMGLTLYQAVLGLLLLLEYAVLFAALGIAINLCFPNFDWSSDVAVVKQSMASFVGIFSGFLLAAVPAGAFFLFPPDKAPLVLAAVAVLIGVLDIAVFALLKGWGSQRFQRL